MLEYSSRSERRRERILAASKAGKFKMNEWLYKSEVHKLKLEGFSVLIIEEAPKSNLYVCEIFWDNPKKDTTAYEFYSIALAVK